MENISFEDWMKLDLRVGKILEAELHPDADKLYVIKVDIGEETPRTIVSGLRDHYELEALIGKKIIVFANLKPAKLRGIESEGMLLAAGKDDKCVLLDLESDIEVGSKVT
ncbi:methionine--tRNA ligase subunit beta [Candidatus Woesearchaeota archaeon]|jgi:methionyl-tRNA synthetase|nr:methionine--tRNA ligase subunit beta [Candidatus Woesearchaeota archaeon]MBT3438779.1 methionine--tRNA ligase subunit beta [Candidatus Woesearchaeota archaeon]MBT4208734.1 methionine--tRNA ligase subunit beta [Candidatus Woesearchaeota archaeon]MBT4783176.1 methionine--tRNA ligase subunit beta [Candidatus Woesearchaeota archaeon]MBT5112200.1 methionine--tRNA ligase subunit beta [Candidatus Woesearchaeota archaeon]